MDIGIIISLLFQAGFGTAMVILINRRRKKPYNGKNLAVLKLGAWIGLIWGWIMIVLSILRFVSLFVFLNAIEKLCFGEQQLQTLSPKTYVDFSGTCAR